MTAKEKHKIYIREYTARHREKINAQRHKKYNERRDEINALRRRRRALKRDCILNTERSYRERNHDKVALYPSRKREASTIYARGWRQRNRKPKQLKFSLRSYPTLEQRRQWNREWRSENKERCREIAREIRVKHRERYLEYRRQYRLRQKSNPCFKIRQSVCSLIGRGIKSGLKSGKALQLLGCSIQSYKIYLESKFEVGMSWQNYGKEKDCWSIDHIIPCALFDLTKPDNQKRCFHFSNTQPMWHIENCSKGDKLTTNQFNLPL